MVAVLGIDAAWTPKQPSGLAVGVKKGARWQIVVASKSYADFLDDPNRSDALPPVEDLLIAAERMAARPIDLVSIDMPLSKEEINGRRLADNAISSAYGARKAGTHTPSSERPGPISFKLMSGLEASGYPLITKSITLPGTIEVYPHPALIELTGASERLTYKAAKLRRFWPELVPSQRRERLVETWQEIIIHLEAKVDGVAEQLPTISSSATGRELKAFEDMLDAIVCVWVGIETIEGRSIAYGDENAAIWVPGPSVQATVGGS